MASTYISRAASGSVTSQTTFTFSWWLKRTKISDTHHTVFMHENASSHTQKFELRFNSDDTFRIETYNGSQEYNVYTARKFRDVNAWYHFVVRVDTTQSTESDRYRVYVNGEQQSLTEGGNGYPAQNATFNLGSKIIVYGRYQASSPSGYLDGVLSHVHYCDGYSYDASAFGSTDSTTGEWKINTSPSVTYGNNGHFILKDGNSVTDQSGNSNNFTVSAGTLTKTEDNPSNIFNVNNPLIVQSANGNHGYGNTNWSTGAASWRMTIGTVGATSGKYYAECQVYGSGGNVHWMNGIVSLDQNMAHSNQYPGGDSGKLGAAYNWDGQKYVNGSNANYGASYGNNDIIGIAMDLDNRKVYFSKNGTWQNSGVPTSGSTGTGAIDIPSSTDAYTFGFSAHNSSMNCNFGNGYFGGTAVSSAGTNASGNGIFEYDCPAGFTALSTKGLNL